MRLLGKYLPLIVLILLPGKLVNSDAVFWLAVLISSATVNEYNFRSIAGILIKGFIISTIWVNMFGRTHESFANRWKWTTVHRCTWCDRCMSKEESRGDGYSVRRTLSPDGLLRVIVKDQRGNTIETVYDREDRVLRRRTTGPHWKDKSKAWKRDNGWQTWQGAISSDADPEPVRRDSGSLDSIGQKQA